MGNAASYGDVSGAVLFLIDIFLVGEGVEVLAGVDAVIREVLLDLVAGEAEAVENHREVDVVPLRMFIRAGNVDTGDAHQPFAVAGIRRVTQGDVLLQVAQVADAHHRGELRHLGIRDRKSVV